MRNTTRVDKELLGRLLFQYFEDYSKYACWQPFPEDYE